MSVAIAIIGFIVVLLLAMVIHELGHFIASKRAGVAVEEFGLGIPPRVFAIKRGETTYSINAIPVGAFVKTAGENDPTVPNGLAGRGPWTRMVVYAAGPVMNLLLAFVILSAFFMVTVSEDIRGDGVMVNSVTEGSPAQEAGIVPGDIILKIGQQQIHSWEDVRKAVNSDGGEAKTVLLDRSGEQFQLDLTPEYDAETDRYRFGVLLCWGIVTSVEDGSPAQQADVRPGDTILGLNGKAIYSQESMLDALSSASVGQNVSVVLLQDGKVVSTTLELAATDGSQPIGVESRWVSGTHIEKTRLPPWEAIYRGGDLVVHIPYLIKESLPIIRENPSNAVVGPIGAGQLTVEAVRDFGFANILFLGGIISIGLALFNLIPIPPLDGGGMLVGLIEGIRRGKRLSPSTVRLAYVIGTIFIVTVFVVVVYSDILRLIRGEGFTL